MKDQLRKGLLSFLMVFTIVFCLFGCSKGDFGPTTNPGAKRPLTDFKVTITRTQNDPGTTSSSYRFDYEIKNVSTADYIANDAPDEIGLRFSITTTDGTSYEYESLLSDLKAGKSYVSFVTINYAAGKTINVSKNKSELYYK